MKQVMNVVLRNMQRLVFSEAFYGQEAIEPMTEWKWTELYRLCLDYGLGPWVAEGFRRYADDFFLQPSDALRQQFLALANAERDDERLQRFKLYLYRRQGWRNKLSRQSLQAYFADFIHAIRNIEE